MATWEWEVLAGPDTICEGPAWDGVGLFYTSIEHNEIRRYDPASSEIRVIYGDSGGSNGLAFDPDGVLYACEGRGRAIARYGTDGEKTLLVERFDGARLNSPNDLVLDGEGRIWFTDPRYGDDHTNRELDHDSVYRLSPPVGEGEAWTIERLTTDTTRPNGLLLSADEQTLYVAQSDYAPGSVRQLRAYPVRVDGSLGTPAVVHDFGPDRGIDGMCWDDTGAIVATCGWELGGPGCRVAVFAPDGTVLEEHPVPHGRPTNCAFGGADRDVLYVTAMDGSLYRVANTGRRGNLTPPGLPPFLG